MSNATLALSLVDIARDALAFGLTKKQAEAIAGKLSAPGKMPGPSYDLDPKQCQTGAKLAALENTVCSGCYAMKGNAVRFAKNIGPGRVSRQAIVAEACDDPAKAGLWVAAMVRLIGKVEWFRWHSAGDIMSARHLELIAAVCELTPHCRHWIPTREYGYVKAFRASNTTPANLTIRVSAHIVGKGAAGLVKAHGNASTVSSGEGFRCPATYTSDKTCDGNGCRACWDRDVASVDYKAH